MHALLVLGTDFCEEQGITFILGHALYMKAIHCGKTYGTQDNKIGNAHLK